MASLLTPRRECQCCTKSDGVCSGEVVVVTTSQTLEVFVRCGPMIDEGSPREQASKFYGCLAAPARGCRCQDERRGAGTRLFP